jgi:formylglycine-generating enzyme required for sulfatase activity
VLGEVGDPRFELRTGPHRAYLLPPLVDIPGGTYPLGDDESRTTPVGIFDNATPEGAFDLSGNSYTWTSSIYDQDKFPYPYRSDDGREDILATGVSRVLRGGSWARDRIMARAVYRNYAHPADRNDNLGFRVVVVLRPPSS